jgi:large subunit ribosomal protein L4
VAFPPGVRNFDTKVNRKARRAALRGALSTHATNGTLALVDGSAFETPSTRRAASLLADWGQVVPTLVLAADDEEALVKSFRNIARVLVTTPAELEVAAVVWANSMLVTQAALPLVLAKAGVGAEGAAE